jgi:uracil-DNA glycosylase
VYLHAHLRLLPRLKVILALGKLAFDGLLATLAEAGHEIAHPRPSFSHAAETTIGPYTVLASYHPSLQNTQTGRLTPAMLDRVLHRARRLLE